MIRLDKAKVHRCECGDRPVNRLSLTGSNVTRHESVRAKSIQGRPIGNIRPESDSHTDGSPGPFGFIATIEITVSDVPVTISTNIYGTSNMLPNSDIITPPTGCGLFEKFPESLFVVLLRPHRRYFPRRTSLYKGNGTEAIGITSTINRLGVAMVTEQQQHDGQSASYYAVLGIGRGASLAEVRSAYRKLAMVRSNASPVVSL